MNFLERQLEDPVRFARIKRWFYLGLAATALAEIVLLLYHVTQAARLADGAEALSPGDHSHFWFENIPAWGSLYGLASCVAIIVVSKFLGKVWLTRQETSYDS